MYMVNGLTYDSPCPMGLCASFDEFTLATLWSKWWTLWSKSKWKLMELLLHISQVGRFKSLQAWRSISTIQANVQGVLILEGGEQHLQVGQGNSSFLWIIMITQWHEHYLCPTWLTDTSHKYIMANLVIYAAQVWQHMPLATCRVDKQTPKKNNTHSIESYQIFYHWKAIELGSCNNSVWKSKQIGHLKSKYIVSD